MSPSRFAGAVLCMAARGVTAAAVGWVTQARMISR
jgi:hypothetical protein